MQVIYEPRGRAQEYSPLAVNLYTGCVHGCKYCYGPAILRKKPEQFHSNVQPRKNILKHLELNCKKMEGDPRQILLCFMTDPYQPINEERECLSPGGRLPLVDEDVTREALFILEKYHMNVSVLTKGGLRAYRDFDILSRNNWTFGTTISFCHGSSFRFWEPNAAAMESRISAIEVARKWGIKTWVSVEPVINPEEALDVMSRLRPSVDYWKIGKVNHMPDLEKLIDWGEFLREAEKLLEGRNYYIKKDLARYRR